MGSGSFRRMLRLQRRTTLGQALSGLEEIITIPLTEERMRAIAASGETRATFVDPSTQATYVVVGEDLYERLTRAEYDDTPWTPEERDALAREAGMHAGWEEMDEYDDDLEKP
jgi:hypothetical protein